MARGCRQKAEKMDKTVKRWKINSCSTWTVVSRSIIRANTLDPYTSFGTRGPSSGASNRQSRRSERRPSSPSFEFFPKGVRDDNTRRCAHYFKGEKSSRRSGYFITCLRVCKILLSCMDKCNFGLIVNRNISFEKHKIRGLDDTSRFPLPRLPHDYYRRSKVHCLTRKKLLTFIQLKFCYYCIKLNTSDR